MNDLPPPDLPTVSYARPLAEGAGFMPVRPTWLIVPHLLAVGLMFVRLASDSPMEMLRRFVLTAIHTGAGPPHLLWDAMLVGPFLMALPLAVWTIRLMFPPPPSRGERAAAWSLAAAMLAPMLLV